MMRKSHKLKVSAPIPADISPDRVIELLHAHTPILKLQAFVQSWREILHPDLDPAIKADLDFFLAARNEACPKPGEPEIKIYSVVEAVPLIPHVGKWAEKEISFPSRMQNVRCGVRAQANAPGGIVVKSDFRVERTDVNAVIDGRIKSDSAPVWQLTEVCEVEAFALLTFFIAADMEKAHRHICQQLISMLDEEVNMDRAQER